MGRGFRVCAPLTSSAFLPKLTHLQKGRGGRGGGRGGKTNRDDGSQHRPYQTFPEVPKENEKFQLYYDGLLNLPEEERQEFWAALKRELPNSFRFCGSKG